MITRKTALGEERVVLIHGLAENPLTMMPVELALRAAGYQVTNIAYPSTLRGIPELLEEYIWPLVGAFDDAEKLHFVTHSLGGVLLHSVLQTTQPSNLGRVVMTAPGLRGSEALEVYRRNWLFRMLYGEAAYRSGTREEGFASTLQMQVNYELGIIAGALPMDPASLFVVPWPHDGKISVGRTKIPGMSDHIVLPTAHDLIASDPIAIAQTLRFLRDGCFFHLMSARATPAGQSMAA